MADEADKDPRICAITAAMPSGTGVDKFAKRHPDRAFDVGIAEEHAVLFAAGMALTLIAKRMSVWSWKAGVTLATVTAIGYDGTVRAALRLTGAPNVDWEDIAVAPGPEMVGVVLPGIDAIGEKLRKNPIVGDAHRRHVVKQDF